MDEIKQYKKDFSKLGGCFAVGTVLVLALQIVVGLVLRSVRPEWLLNVDISLFISSILMYGITFPIIIWLAGKVPSKAPERHPLKAGKVIVAMILCLSVMYISNIIGIIITAMIGAAKGSLVDNPAQTAVMSSNLWVIMLLMVIVAPIMEELLFRKVLIDRVVRYGEGVAILLSGLMFALFHGNLNQFVYAFALGVFFAFLYVKTGNVKITMFLHAFINFMGSVVAQSMLKLVRYDEMLKLDSTDMNAMMAFMMDNLGGWAIFMLYAFLVFGLVIAGGIMLIVFAVQKRFRVNAGEKPIPKGRKFQTVFLNLGMLVYCLIWIVGIVLQLLQ